jgi:hypothetical protein
MTLPKNQGFVSPPNTLHDQGVPNTLSQMSAPIPDEQTRIPVAALVAAMVLILAVGAILVARLA